MNYALDTLRLLIAHDSQDEAEQLMNTLRNAGRATRAQLALGEDDLVRALKGGAWELMLCRPTFGDGSFESAMAHLGAQGETVYRLGEIVARSGEEEQVKLENLKA